MAVIELGLLTTNGDDPAPGPGHSPLHRRQRRRLLIAVVAAFCLLTVTGSARPGPGALPRLWSAPFTAEADTFRLVGDTIYVLSQQTDRRLTAQDARTGELRWTYTGVDETSWMTAVAAGALLMPTGVTSLTQREPDGSSSTLQFSRDTMALDTATGRQLWRQRGEVVTVVGDQVLLSEWNETGQRSRGLRLVRLRDGGTVWSRVRGDLTFWTTDTTPGGPADRVVTVTPDGRAEVIATADGTVVTTGRLPWTVQTRENDYSMVSVQGRRLYLDQTVRNESSISAYETDTLRRLWRVEQSMSGGSYGCGPVVCVSDGATTTGHDRETGELRWRLIGAANGYPLPGGGLVLDDGGGVRRILIDGATGRRLADLGSAMPVWDSLGRGTPYLMARTTQPAGLTSVSTLDPRSGRVRLRGAIPAIVDYACQNEGDLLACVTQDNRLAVTDVG